MKAFLGLTALGIVALEFLLSLLRPTTPIFSEYLRVPQI